MADFNQARKNMVDGQIHTNGVTIPELLHAFETLPREQFVPEAYKKLACNDEDIPLGHGRYILEPSVHARMIEALEPQKDDVVLEIGGGTGYGAAIMSELVSTIVMLEEEKEFITVANRIFDHLSLCNIALFEGALIEGCPKHGPFDSIIINGAVSEIPENLLNQLNENGKLICVLKPAGRIMGQVCIFKKANGEVSKAPLFDAATPYLKGFEPKTEFQF